MNQALETLTKKLKDGGFSLTTVRKAIFLSLLDKEPQTIS